MKLSYYTLISSLFALAGGGVTLVPPQAAAQVAVQAEATSQEQGVEVLTRGPVHEAFAATVSFDPQPGVTVTKAPPELIEEIPPDQRPTGDNVTWIPGYWGWEEDSSDFIWISGIWRNLPPDRQWVPGYWAESGSEWQWTSGYWANEDVDEVVYLPKPPATVEVGPNVDAPSSNHIWIPGNWVYRDDRYAWSPGYWEPAHENWIWIPAHYQWSRRGYVFVDGYWDYQVARRGVVFAPVRFEREIYTRRSYTYRPTTVINVQVFADHLFVRPRYEHYYFGDYYEPRYEDRGFFASFTYHGNRGYDPIYAYSRWEHRDDREWERARRERFDFYRKNEDARPPRTWTAFQEGGAERRRERREDYAFAQPLEVYARETDRRQKFEPVTAEYRERVVAQRQEVRKFSKERQQLESRADDRPEADRKQARREKLAKSPVVGKRADQLQGDLAPPKKIRQEKTEDRPGRQVPSEGTTTGKDKLEDEKDREARARTPQEQAEKDATRDKEAKPADEAARRDRAEAVQRERREAREMKPGEADAAQRREVDRTSERRERGDSARDEKEKPTRPQADPDSKRRAEPDRATPQEPEREKPSRREGAPEPSPQRDQQQRSGDAERPERQADPTLPNGQPSSSRRVEPDRPAGEGGSNRRADESESRRQADPAMPDGQPSSSRRVEPQRSDENSGATRRVEPAPSRAAQPDGKAEAEARRAEAERQRLLRERERENGQ
jgi:hypothetical protein